MSKRPVCQCGSAPIASQVKIVDHQKMPTVEEDAMSEEALYWVLSTLPQVAAAFVAFIGFLALQSLVEPYRRCGQLEDSCRQHVGDVNRNVPIGDFGSLKWFEIDALPAEILMRNVAKFTKEPNAPAQQQSPGTITLLSTYYREWERLDTQIGTTRRVLTVFVLIHVVLITVCLSLIPFITSLVNARWTIAATIATIIVMGGSVAIMMFFVFNPTILGINCGRRE
jgi:hypothetical protein